MKVFFTISFRLLDVLKGRLISADLIVEKRD
jgi:hypothetical protein